MSEQHRRDETPCAVFVRFIRKAVEFSLFMCYHEKNRTTQYDKRMVIL